MAPISQQMSDNTIIEISKASVYQKDILILSNINLQIDKGEFVYLIGKTGTGKSSLLKMLYADLPLVNGEAKIAGYNLKTIRNKEIPYLRRKIGIVFQDFQLLIDRSVNENLYVCNESQQAGKIRKRWSTPEGCSG